MRQCVSPGGRLAAWAAALALFVSGCAPIATPTATVAAATPTVPAVSAAALDLPDPTVGLAALDSYSATLTLTFAGIRAGEPLIWTDVYALSAQPAARQLTITPHGDLTARVPTILAELDGQAYTAPAGQPCVVTPLDPAASAIDPLAPAAQLVPVQGALPAGADSINGQPAQRYAFDAAALGAAATATAAGNLWLATAGGYVLRYTMTITGTASFFPNTAQGVYTWDYELTGLNTPVPIAPPVGCRPS